MLYLLCKKQRRRHAFRRASQREIRFGARILLTARFDTTSELPVGNSRTGAPVTVPMSGEVIRNQGGTVEYFCIPPLIFSGGGYFLYLLPCLPCRGGAQCAHWAEGLAERIHPFTPQSALLTAPLKGEPL